MFSIYSILLSFLLINIVYANGPAEPELVFSQILHRHGDRTPIHFLENEDSYWHCTLDQYIAPAIGDEEPKRLYRKQFREGVNPIPGNCMLGELTDIGRAQHEVLGKKYKYRYTKEHSFLSEELNEEEISLRSTEFYRTQQSISSFVLGLYDPKMDINSTRIEEKLTIWITDIETDELLPPSPVWCPALKRMEEYMFNSPQWIARERDFNEPLRKELELTGMGPTLPEAGTDALFDILFARWSHNIPFPVDVTYDHFERVTEQANWEMRTRWSFMPIRRLGMGPFVKTLIKRIEHKMRSMMNDMNDESPPDPVKLSIYSGHDYSVGPLMATLGIFKYWPNYASSIALELYKDNLTGQWWIQLLYDFEPISIPGCAAYYDTNHSSSSSSSSSSSNNNNSNTNNNNNNYDKEESSWCLYSTFLELVAPIIPTDLEKECDYSYAYMETKLSSILKNPSPAQISALVAATKHAT